MTVISFKSRAFRVPGAASLSCGVALALAGCSATDPPPDETIPVGTTAPTRSLPPVQVPGAPGAPGSVPGAPTSPIQAGPVAPPTQTPGIGPAPTSTAPPVTGVPGGPDPGAPIVPATPGTVTPPPVVPTAAAPTEPSPSGGQIEGIEFMQRIAGKWTGINSNTPIGFDFPLTVDFAPSSESFMFGEFEIDAQNNVVWGFNVENYGGKDVLAYRNGGYLLGVLRDSRTALVEHDTARGYYRFCAVKEHGLPVDGCNYIDARYTFTAPDRMLFEVTTRSGEPHVHWEAARVETRALPSVFPASLASQGDGSTPWPAAAGFPTQ